MASLDLPDSPSTLVWRLIVERLRGNVVLARVIRTWLTWDGSRYCNVDVASDAIRSPALRIYPTEGTMDWYSADQMVWPLQIALEASVPGMDVEDVLNLHGAIVGALYPDDHDDELAWEQSLRDVGAETGIVQFSTPLAERHETAGGGGGFHPVGMMRINVLRTVTR